MMMEDMDYIYQALDEECSQKINMHAERIAELIVFIHVIAHDDYVITSANQPRFKEIINACVYRKNFFPKIDHQN